MNVTLIGDGTLGSCWYGNYHYIEPWVGCSHGCYYCYARSRPAVMKSLTQLGTDFGKPTLICNRSDLHKRIINDIEKNKVQIAKVSRFTDIFDPRSVKSGDSAMVLNAIVSSKVKRVILTTKGLPDEACLDIIRKNPSLISFNMVIKPESENFLEPHVPSISSRLRIAREISEYGVLTTIHMDPLLLSVYDSERAWTYFLTNIKEYALKRVMFSYLFLDDEIIKALSSVISEKEFKTILADFDLSKPSNCEHEDIELPLYYFKADIRKKHSEMLARILTKLGMDFVLCSNKSAADSPNIDRSLCPHCDGNFYA